MPDDTEAAVGRGQHKRNGEGVDQRHARWHDTTRAQIAIALALLTLLGSALGAGYAARDFIVGVQQDLPEMVVDNTAEHAELWRRVNRQDTTLRTLLAAQRQTSEVVVELFCYLTQGEEQQQEQCIREQTQRRIERLLPNGGSGSAQ